MSKQMLIATIILALLLAACGGAPAVPPTAVPPTATPVPATPEPTVPEPTVAPTEPTPEPVDADPVEAEASNDNVTLRRLDGNQEALAAPNQAFMGVGEGVSVDDGGRAILRFRNTFAVEVLRNGDLDLAALESSEQSVFARVRQRAGATVNNFNPEEEIDHRFVVETDFATITATGTSFAVVSEANSPLEWIIGLDAPVEDLTVEADGLAKTVVTNQARWIAPVGVPSAGIDADMAGWQQWIDNARAGVSQSELGEVIWPQADAVADSGAVAALPAPGETAPFGETGVTFGLDPEGLFGQPVYTLEDCNGDGITDIAIENGRLTLDYRTVLARVRSVDVTMFNRGEAGGGALVGRDPATEVIGRSPLTAGPGQCEVLSLRADVPYHYADLEVGNACLLGISLTPPAADGEAGPPRAAVASCGEAPPEPTPAPEPTPPPADSAQIVGITVQGGRYYVDFVTYGFEPQLPGQHVHFFWNTVPPEQAGVPGSGPWQLYPAAPGQPNSSPFTMFAVDQRPPDASQICILVANPDHSVRQGSGNCYALP